MLLTLFSVVPTRDRCEGFSSGGLGLALEDASSLVPASEAPSISSGRAHVLSALWDPSRWFVPGGNLWGVREGGLGFGPLLVPFALELKSL